MIGVLRNPNTGMLCFVAQDAPYGPQGYGFSLMELSTNAKRKKEEEEETNKSSVCFAAQDVPYGPQGGGVEHHLGRATIV